VADSLARRGRRHRRRVVVSSALQQSSSRSSSSSSGRRRMQAGAQSACRPDRRNSYGQCPHLATCVAAGRSHKHTNANANTNTNTAAALSNGLIGRAPSAQIHSADKNGRPMNNASAAAAN
jgi:hypothetical protein